MVFESVLSQVLNKVLGDYVENLDGNQLKIGIWGGDVQLNNLVIKQSALDDLDLPVQTVYGRIGKLALKIPWKNLYGAPFLIDIEDIYLLAQPNQQVRYDAAKELTKHISAKQKAIQQIELTKKKELEKDKPPTDFTFAEKLITQIIKNIQLNIKNIHIRYEDKITSPTPFALGITLAELNVLSTDENWVPAITKEDITKIFKIVDLHGLAVYWNCDTKLCGELPVAELVETLLKDIVSKHSQPSNYRYVLGPINSTARLRINQRPECDSPAFSIPKIHLNLDMEKLSIAISKAQYKDIIALAESMDSMMKGIPYRKFRPNLARYRGHYKEWWHFAYRSILEETVRRKRKNWDWNHILSHRNLCREYGKLYEKKLSNNKVSAEDAKVINQCEIDIDTFNIAIIRQRVELECERREKKPVPRKSWFSFWGGSSESVDKASGQGEIRKQFEQALSKDEKARLYQAIGYQENAAPSELPDSYVDNSFGFLLRTLEVELSDEACVVQKVLLTELKGVTLRIDTRSAASALQVNVKIDEFTTFGMEQDAFIPRMIISDTDSQQCGLLEVTFETNPLDKACDQRIHVAAQPLKIIYDAQSINKVVDIFRLPSSTHLDQLTAAAEGGLHNIKEMSSTGIQHAIDLHSNIDINIDFQAPYIIVPYGGKYLGEENVLVINLGNIKVRSLTRPPRKDLVTMNAEKMTDHEIRTHLIKDSYDRYEVELNKVQLLVAQTDENWELRIKDGVVSEMHLLEPVSLKVTLEKCIFSDDPRLPLMKISGELPSVVVNVAEERLLLLVALGTSIPFPEAVPPSEPLKKGQKKGSSMMLAYKDIQDKARKTQELIPKMQDKSDFVQFTTLEMHFVISDLAVHIRQQTNISTQPLTIASFYTKSLEFALTQQTYNSVISLSLGALGLNQYFMSKEIGMISSPEFEDKRKYLFRLNFIQVNRSSPEFHSKHKSCESTLDLEFAKLAVVLHREGLLSLIEFATVLQRNVEDSMVVEGKDRYATTSSFGGDIKRQISTISEEFTQLSQPERKTARKTKPAKVETIKFKLIAKIDELSVEFATQTERISSWAIQGIYSKIILKNSYTQIDAQLNQIAVIDLNPSTVHNLIMTVCGKEALTTQIVVYNQETSIGGEVCDMSIKLTVGGIRIVFLNWFVSRMLNFVNEFESARTALVEASEAAAKTARENVQNAYAKATKISLVFDIKAPAIIMPENSQSYDAILLDFGHLSITNHFISLDLQNEENLPAVIDEIKLSLSQFKLSRVSLTPSLDIEHELNLLVPVTFKLVVKRNLSASWYKALPDLDILGRIFNFEVFISKMDYNTIMGILNGNLGEGQNTNAKIVEAKVDALKTEVLPAILVVDQQSITPSEREFTLAQNESESKSHTFLRFNFTMDNVQLQLFVGGSKQLTSKCLTREDLETLAKFSLEGISLKVRMLTDNSIIVSFLLLNCYLDDMRKGREGKLNRLIQRSAPGKGSVTQLHASTESLSSRSMIDVVVQVSTEHIFTDVKVYSFTLILSVDYLLIIADFLKIENEKEAVVPNQHLTGKKLAADVAVQTAGGTAAVQKPTQITLNLKIEQPDIILVEHMDNIDTKALILNSEVIMKLRLIGERQVINGAVNDLQLYTCLYDPEKRAATRVNVLYPVTFSLAGSTPPDKGLHLELLATDIQLSVSPSTIELLSRVVATATGSNEAFALEEGETADFASIWNPKPFVDQEFWFMRNIDVAVEADENLLVGGNRRQVTDEVCIVALPSILITIEAGVGQKTLPMLVIETSLNAKIRDWSSQLSADSTLKLQMSYYNSKLALWEPLIEQVEVVKYNNTVLTPWELKVDVNMNERELASPSDSEMEPLSQQPTMNIEVSSETNLEVVMTKTCLEVLGNLATAFADAMKLGEYKAVDVEAPYKVVNELGYRVTVNLQDSSFSLHDEENTPEVILESSAAAALQLRSSGRRGVSSARGTIISTTLALKEYYLYVHVSNKDSGLMLPVVKADKRYFPLGYGKDCWGIISDIKVDEGVTIVTLRSILQVHNHFNVPIDIYYMTSRGDELAMITTIEPNATFNVPLNAVYTPTNALFFAVNGYSVTNTPYVWKDLQTNLTKTETLYCSARANETNGDRFVIQAVGEIEQVFFQNTSKYTMTSSCYNIHLRPAVIFKNSLPVDIVCCVEHTATEMSVAPGGTLIIPNAEPGALCIVVRLPEYLEKEWSSRQELSTDPTEFQVWVFHSYDSAMQMSLNLGMHTVNKNGSMVLTLYCPFWMLNKTGLTLAYRSSDEATNVLHHPADFKGPILFSFNAKNFFGKKKASVRIGQGAWSEKFSLDVAGSSGVVLCKQDDSLHQIGVNNQLTYNGLTKQVTFMPYFVIINNAAFTIECQESDRAADPWVTVEPNSCAALWPKSKSDEKLLRVRIHNTTEVSAPFLYTDSHTTLLKLKNKYGGINVDIQITEGAVYINLAPYTPGTAPALIINHTSHPMKFWEKDSVQVRELPPRNYILHTWENPSGSRLLSWEAGNKKECYNDLRKDYIGEYTVNDDEQVYWVSFLDGMQRILLFTHEQIVAENAQAANLYEIIQQELTISIYGLGLSLINNTKRQEVMYMALASSGIVWETCKMSGKRYKPLPQKETLAIEAAYQGYLTELEQAAYSETAVSKMTIVDAKTEVDFGLNIMSKPHHRKIRRTFQTGLWVKMKSSPSQLQIHAKVNRLQIDNQMYDCIFPVVLAPVPIPKSVAIDSGIKPFAELSIVQLLMKNTQIKQYKYFKLLIQEFHVKVDLGFVNALVELFETSKYSDEDERQMFLKDAAVVNEPLYAHVSTQSMQEQKSFYDLLHFSPLKIHVSFSIASGSDASSSATPNFVNVLLQGLGVTLTDLQDVVFKLAYFERDCSFLTNKQLVSEATTHYTGQAVKQLYVLVLGLDVLGNPYGLVRGITQGVEDLFYEPFQGAIQGPGEFAEGLVLGMKSLFGHTVGGAAGAVSRMTGALGKGLAALTFDEDYQRKRRDQINKKPATVQEGLARGGKGLVMGVFDGVTGVFTKPISGAKEEGFGGFLKGVGKGAVGLVTRPTAGVVDFASGSLDVVKRAAEFSEDTTRMRTPRFLQGDGLVRPYNLRQSMGHKLLTELEKGKFASTDIYDSHFDVILRKEILLLTDKRIAYVTHNDIFGGWQVDWAYTWPELTQPPSVIPKGVAIQTNDKKKKLNLFGSGDNGKIILISDPAQREEVCSKIEWLRGKN